ncbi:hypothetical protein [Alicyclobacillus ferrooxydans]|uniref:Uncharacterized protein n=1 Tax=Alicyclobacillus ferrooxydans TaxID=471514 RepID=A0A0P9GV49_9BACL|nr:hypothetical protein [Alicyclobacillus ferrooxydans]KPV45123.1 hypothetical protein AN477_03825 [Alicyclobacillus ferrooxydans]
MDVMSILRTLTPGSPVSVWFSNSNFLDTNFQFYKDNQVAFSGGDLSGLTYINVGQIKAIRVR